MKRSQMLGSSLACGFLLAACASDEQKAVEAGAIMLSQSEIAMILPGNTIKGEGPRGQLISYYHKDGRKLIREGNHVAKRKWWVNDGGQWCETLAADESKRFCGMRLYKDGYSLTWYTRAGAVIGSFSLVSGDRHGLERPYSKIRPANNSELPPADKSTVK